MTTLHAYILRELLKTFGLTVLALTALFTMGGGVYNVVGGSGIGTSDIFAFLPMLIPIVITLTMPVAGLFAAASVYGRLAADNEFVACRAAGINVHRLFLSAGLLGVFIALFTLVSANYVIPDFMKRLDRAVRANIRDWVFHKLRTNGHIRFPESAPKYLLTAEQVLGVPDEILAEQRFETGPGFSYIWVVAPAFLELDKAGQVTRFTVARFGLCQFDTSQSDVKVSLWVVQGRDFEIGRRAVEIDGQKIASFRRPIPLPNRPSWQTLDTLFHWRDRPWEAPKIREESTAFLLEVEVQRFYQEAKRALSAGQRLQLIDDVGQVHDIRAAACEVSPDGTLVLEDVRLELPHAGQPRPTRFLAPRGQIKARPLPDYSIMVELRLARTADEKVRELSPLAEDDGVAREVTTLNIDRLKVPDRIHDEVASWSLAEVHDRGVRIELPTELDDKRIALWTAAEAFQRKVGSLVHFRLGYAASPFVTILMAAALGVMFRGARALAAFGLACVPFGTVTILMIMGRQLGENEATQLVGPWIIWCGLVAMAVADVLILYLGVRR